MTSQGDYSDSVKDRTDALIAHGDRLTHIVGKLSDTVRTLLKSEQLSDDDKERLLRLSSALYGASNLLADTAEEVEVRFDRIGAHIQPQPEKSTKQPSATIEVDGAVIAVSPAAKEVWDILSTQPDTPMYASDIFSAGSRPHLKGVSRKVALSNATRQLRGLERTDVPALVVAEGSKKRPSYRISATMPNPVIDDTSEDAPITNTRAEITPAQIRPLAIDHQAKHIDTVKDSTDIAAIAFLTVTDIIDSSSRPIITIHEITHRGFNAQMKTAEFNALKQALKSDERIRYVNGGEYVIVDREGQQESINDAVIKDIVERTLTHAFKTKTRLLALPNVTAQERYKNKIFLTHTESNALLKAFGQHPCVESVSGPSIILDLAKLEKHLEEPTIDDKLKEAHIKDNVGFHRRR